MNDYISLFYLNVITNPDAGLADRYQLKRPVCMNVCGIFHCNTAAWRCNDGEQTKGSAYTRRSALLPLNEMMGMLYATFPNAFLRKKICVF